MESFFFKQDTLEPDTFLLSPEGLEGPEGPEGRTVDPDTQARLEALLDAAGEQQILNSPGYILNSPRLHP